MQNKYYTPKIEELSIGFEYQQYSHLKGLWESLILDYSRFITILDEERCDWDEHNIRVKYLDEEDIKDLGFTFKDKNFIPNDYEFYKKGKYNFTYKIQIFWHTERTQRNNLVRVFNGYEYDFPYTELFRGNIKNKSELKKILGMIT